MFQRFTIAAVAMLGMVLMLNRVVYSAEKAHEGKVVSVTEGKNNADGKLVMTDKDGKNEHTHMISTSAKITINGKAAKLGEIKKGDSVKVMADDKQKVSSVSVTRS